MSTATEPPRPTRQRTGWTFKALAGIVVGGIVLFGALAARQNVAEDESLAPPAVEVRRQAVRLVTAREMPIQAWTFTEGTARAVKREYLTFDLTGRVTYVKPQREGEPVKKGEVLAQLDKRKYVADVDSARATLEEAKTKAAAAEAEIAQSNTQYELARREFERHRQLRERNATTQAQFDEAQAKLENARAMVQASRAQAQAVQAGIAAAEARLRQAEVTLEDAEIVSPIEGVIAYLNVKEGYYFTPNLVRTTSEAEALQTVPIVVIDPSEYEITVDVPSYEGERVHVGQQVLLLPGGSSEGAVIRALETGETLRGEQSRSWQARGEVFSVNPAVNPGGRSIQIKIRTTEGAEHLRDGMFVTCWIATEQKPNAVAVPFDAFLYEENRPYVFVYDPETSKVQRRTVQIGIQGLTQREVLSGVEAGEQLVTDGRYRLVDGAPVKVLEN